MVWSGLAHVSPLCHHWQRRHLRTQDRARWPLLNPPGSHVASPSTKANRPESAAGLQGPGQEGAAPASVSKGQRAPQLDQGPHRGQGPGRQSWAGSLSVLWGRAVSDELGGQRLLPALCRGARCPAHSGAAAHLSATQPSPLHQAPFEEEGQQEECPDQQLQEIHASSAPGPQPACPCILGSRHLPLTQHPRGPCFSCDLTARSGGASEPSRAVGPFLSSGPGYHGEHKSSVSGRHRTGDPGQPHLLLPDRHTRPPSPASSSASLHPPQRPQASLVCSLAASSPRLGCDHP